MPDLIFDIAAWKAANSLRGIQEGNQDDAQTRRIKMLADVLPTVTDPAMQAQIAALLQDDLETVEQTKKRRAHNTKYRQQLDARVAVTLLGCIIIIFLFTRITSSRDGSSNNRPTNAQATREIRSEGSAAATAEPDPDMTLLRKVRVGTLVTSDVGTGTVMARNNNYTNIRWGGDYEVSYTDRNLATMLNTGSITIK